MRIRGLSGAGASLLGDVCLGIRRLPGRANRRAGRAGACGGTAMFMPLAAAQYDGAVVTLSVLVLNPVTVGGLMLAVHLRAPNKPNISALIWPRLRSVTIGIIGIVIIIALTDALLVCQRARDRIAIPGHFLHHRRRRRLAAADVVRDRAGGASRRRDHVSRLFVPRLRALGAFGAGLRSSSSRCYGPGCTCNTTGPAWPKYASPACFSAGCAGAQARRC